MIGDKELRASVDRYLDSVRAQAQAEIAKALREAMTSGKLGQQGSTETAVALTCDKIGLNVSVYSKIGL
ncbi:MAG: hypothetical protein JSR72_07595 [Proteobacteria bacterium]|nr:hypothetical protein [Pseudomonadota bacterium]